MVFNPERGVRLDDRARVEAYFADKEISEETVQECFSYLYDVDDAVLARHLLENGGADYLARNPYLLVDLDMEDVAEHFSQQESANAVRELIGIAKYHPARELLFAADFSVDDLYNKGLTAAYQFLSYTGDLEDVLRTNIRIRHDMNVHKYKNEASRALKRNDFSEGELQRLHEHEVLADMDEVILLCSAYQALRLGESTLDVGSFTDDHATGSAYRKLSRFPRVSDIAKTQNGLERGRDFFFKKVGREPMGDIHLEDGPKGVRFVYFSSYEDANYFSGGSTDLRKTVSGTYNNHERLIAVHTVDFSRGEDQDPEKVRDTILHEEQHMVYSALDHNDMWFNREYIGSDDFFVIKDELLAFFVGGHDLFGTLIALGGGYNSVHGDEALKRMNKELEAAAKAVYSMKDVFGDGDDGRRILAMLLAPIPLKNIPSYIEILNGVIMKKRNIYSQLRTKMRVAKSVLRRADSCLRPLSFVNELSQVLEDLEGSSTAFSHSDVARLRSEQLLGVVDKATMLQKQIEKVQVRDGLPTFEGDLSLEERTAFADTIDSLLARHVSDYRTDIALILAERQYGSFPVSEEVFHAFADALPFDAKIDRFSYFIEENAIPQLNMVIKIQDKKITISIPLAF